MRDANPIQTKKALILVRTYPTPAIKGVEVSCTAAITEDGEWLRLFPVPYRLLDHDKRFRKYQWIEVSVKKSNDLRPESYKIVPDSIKIISDVMSTDDDWHARRTAVEKLRGHCLCCVKTHRQAYGSPTLGLVRPKRIVRLIIEEDNSEWSGAQLAALSQDDLFQPLPKEGLEKIPYSFRYEFVCDEPSCPGHKISCTDWEMGEAYRKWRRAYGEGWEKPFRQKFEDELISERDLQFFVGTIHQYPDTWIIVGLFYPPKVSQLEMFIPLT